MMLLASWPAPVGLGRTCPLPSLRPKLRTALVATALLTLPCALLPTLCAQVEGGFVQGMGWSCIEELVWGDKQHAWVRPGQLFTRGPGTYKVGGWVGRREAGGGGGTSVVLVAVSVRAPCCSPCACLVRSQACVFPRPNRPSIPLLRRLHFDILPHRCLLALDAPHPPVVALCCAALRCHPGRDHTPHASSTPCPLQIPTANDIPVDFRVTLLRNAPCERTPMVHSSKAVGEPPFFLGTSVFFALKVGLGGGGGVGGVGWCGWVGGWGGGGQHQSSLVSKACVGRQECAQLSA